MKYISSKLTIISIFHLLSSISLFNCHISLIQKTAILEAERLKTQFEQSTTSSLLKKSLNECDLITDGPICLFNGSRILLPYAKQRGLVGHWSFDEIRPIDQSGNGNHAIGSITPGPSFGGYGASALFYSGELLQIPHTDIMSSDHFALTFWLFIVEDYFTADKGGRYCPFAQKGNDDLPSKLYQRSPAIVYDRQEKDLEIYITTTDSDEGEHFSSQVKIFPQKWVHIAITTTSNNEINLYINGILDTSLPLKGKPKYIKDPLYLGNVPWLKGECSFPFLIDEVRYYNDHLMQDYIQAEASPVLGGIEPNFLRIGCKECLLAEATAACKDGYRLCSSIELHTGGYQIARSLGLLSWDTHIWTNGALGNKADYATLRGLGLCCALLK